MPKTKIRISLIPLSLALGVVINLSACNKEKPENNQAVSVQTVPATTEVKPTIVPAAPIQNGRVAELQRQADEGDPDAQYNLAYMYENGIDVPKDEAKAIELYEKAAFKGHNQAQESLKNIHGH